MEADTILRMLFEELGMLVGYTGTNKKEFIGFA
jgi:hypothetical protein